MTEALSVTPESIATTAKQFGPLPFGPAPFAFSWEHPFTAGSVISEDC